MDMPSPLLGRRPSGSKSSLQLQTLPIIHSQITSVDDVSDSQLMHVYIYIYTYIHLLTHSQPHREAV